MHISNFDHFQKIINSSLNSLVGLSIEYKDVGVETRDRLAGLGEGFLSTAKYLVGSKIAYGLMFLNTCNRTEVYLHLRESSAFVKWCQGIINFIGVPISSILLYKDDDLFRHVLMLNSGLRSSLFGESEISSQIKKSYHAYQDNGLLSKNLCKLMQFSLKHSKVIRTKTVIAKSKISIGAISISLLDKFFNNPESKKVLLIGFGELGQTIFKYLVDHNYNDLEICSSSHSKEVYATNSIYIPKQDIAANLYKYDIVICSSANARHIITSKDLISSMELRKYNTQVVIDLAVPCNVEAPKQLEHLYYYTNDELSKISASNMKNRKLALYQSDSYIEQALIEYKNWCDEQDKLPAVIELRNKYKELLKPLIAGSINRIERGHDPKEEIELFANKLLNKFLHSPTKALKNSNDKDLEFIIDLLV